MVRSCCSTRGIMRTRSHFVVALIVAMVSLLPGASAEAAGRVALVIGNAGYRNEAALPSPGNDAARRRRRAATAGLFRHAGPGRQLR